MRLGWAWPTLAITLNGMPYVNWGSFQCVCTKPSLRKLWSLKFQLLGSLYHSLNYEPWRTLVFSSSGSLSEHQPVQWLQNLQFHNFFRDYGREVTQLVQAMKKGRIVRHLVYNSLQFFQWHMLQCGSQSYGSSISQTIVSEAAVGLWSDMNIGFTFYVSVY